jgi:hypothetical protein
MIKSEHLHKDITDLVAVENSDKLSLYEKAMLRASILNLKLLVNIRQNQVQIMNAQGVPTLKAKNNVATS